MRDELPTILSRTSEFSFDPTANTLYITIKKAKVVKTKPLTFDIIVDFDEKDEIVGIEILNVAGRLDKLIEESSFKR